MIVMLIPLLCGSVAGAQEEEVVGERPYEMVWANRTEDDHPPLIDFEDLTGWTIETQDTEALFERSREQQIWGQHVGKLTYKMQVDEDAEEGSALQPGIWLRPPEPIRIDDAFDAVTMWVYGNNWAFSPDPTTPPVAVSALFLDSEDNEFGVRLESVRWREWFLCHERLTPEQIELVTQGARFSGLSITGGRNEDERVIYLDNLAVFTEELQPLTFEPRRRRGIDMFPGQGTGTNTGPGKLPFPTRKETILPEVRNGGYKTLVDDGFDLVYAGPDQYIEYHIGPETGSLGDIRATVEGVTIRPCVHGGVYFATDDAPQPPERAEHLGTELLADPDFDTVHTREGAKKVVSRWRMEQGDRSTEVTFTYRLWGKSLVIDVVAPGGEIAEVRYGAAMGTENPRLVTIPFYPAAAGQSRPAVLVAGAADEPMFLMGNTCWYLSNASLPFAVNEIDGDRATYNGGTRYIPTTDGHRNDVYERFFITVSYAFEEVLPTIPNPVSPWKHITGTRVWRAHGASNRDEDLKRWRQCHRYGMTEVVITDHETGWRDDGESFTFRTRTAPKKGGDESQYAYARALQDELGFVYGPYNNYTDFAPVNEYWSMDRVNRTPSNQLQTAWPRCYAPKPSIAVEFCEMLAPIIEEKFHFSTAYCDVHTAVAPWDRVDYDCRVPGAGTFGAVFYSYGEIMLLQKKAWGGPVYSEGNNHAFYCGLTDGNYGQDYRYGPNTNPWLVDFDLRKMHDLCCNFGMGMPSMFFGRRTPLGSNEQEIDGTIDRFLCATVAFGHPGFLTYDGGGLRTALRSYYMLQQLHSRYCLSSAREIRYADADGRLLDTSAAVAGGAFERSQIVTRYRNGCVTVCNGHRTERMKVSAFGREVDLPPNGYVGWMPDGSIEVLSADPTGRRTDYAVTPAYIFVDGRGEFTRFEKAAANGIGICRVLGDGEYEYIPYEGSESGFAIGSATAIAIDEERNEIGPAEVRLARGFTYVMPVEGAFSYLLTQAGAPNAELTCERDTVVGGETVIVRGRDQHEVSIPPDAKPTDRLWYEFEGAWIDFTVMPLADVELAINETSLIADLASNLPQAIDAEVRLGRQRERVTLEPAKTTRVELTLAEPTREDVEVIALQINAEPYRQTVERVLRTVRGYQTLATVPGTYETGMRLRGEEETSDVGETRAYVAVGSSTCGRESKQGWTSHPPWTGAVGYSFALYDPIELPDTPATFRAAVGKGDGSDPGDGILYKVEVVDQNGQGTIAGQQLVAKHEWLTLEGDLSQWAGRTVRLKVIVDVGEDDNSSGDWGCWADMRIETPGEVLVRTLESDAERYRRETGPFPIEGLTPADLRGAKAGWTHYDGCGLSGSGEYGTIAVLNGIEVGEMAPAGGIESQNIWIEQASVPLTPEAIESLGRRNELTIANPRRDWFKIRRFWIELELADGRKCSSDISTATYTQPPSWPYAEGIGVPHGEDITVDVWFDVEE